MAARKRFVKSKPEGLSFAESATVVTDTETGVQYLFVQSGYSGGLTVLVDREGKPLLDFEAGRDRD